MVHQSPNTKGQRPAPEARALHHPCATPIDVPILAKSYLPRGPSDAGPANRRHQPCAGRSPRGLCHQDDGLQDARKRLQKPSFEPSKPGDVVCSSRDPRRSSQQRGSGPERPSTHQTDSVSFLVPLHMVHSRGYGTSYNAGHLTFNVDYTRQLRSRPHNPNPWFSRLAFPLVCCLFARPSQAPRA